MSAVLDDFLDPYWDSAETLEQMNRLVTIGMIAWNAALVTGAEREKLTEKTLATVDPDARQAALPFLAELIRRKEKVFPDNKRFILNCHLTMTPTGPHLAVISSFTPP